MKVNYRKIVNIFVFVSLILAIIGVIVMMIISPSKQEINVSSSNVNTDHSLMLTQCILGVIALLLPIIIERKLKIKIPSSLASLYALFIYAATFLGEVLSFYYKIPHFDTALHTISGAMIAILGLSIISLMNKSDNIPANLSPIFIACFTLCFALALGVVWEIYEFSADAILGSNMQKFALSDGTNLIGRAAVMDTMKDLIVDLVGALVVAIISYISIKHKKGLVEKLLIRKVNNKV